MSLFAIGLGYSAKRLIERGALGPAAGTARTAAGVEAWRRAGVDAFPFDGTELDPGLSEALRGRDVLLISAPPDANGDPALRVLSAAIAEAGVGRILYLSTVGVYGDAAGAWVEEESPTDARTPRARARLRAEAGWRALGAEIGAPVDILRLAGIYGPGRSAIDRLRDGTARRIVKPGQVFNRIHVDDIASAVEAVVAAAGPGDIYNVADGAPSPPEDVIAYAAELLGAPLPPAEDFATARQSDMSRSFYEENRRVRAQKLEKIGWKPQYPSYRDGLAAIAAL